MYPVPMFGQVTYLQTASSTSSGRTFALITTSAARTCSPFTTPWTITRIRVPVMVVSSTILPFPAIDNARSQNAGMTWTHTLSPSMVNEAKMSYLRSHAGFPCTDCQFRASARLTNSRLGFWHHQRSAAVLHGKHLPVAGQSLHHPRETYLQTGRRVPPDAKRLRLRG